VEERPDPELGQGPRRLKGVLALLAAPGFGLERMLPHAGQIGVVGAIAGLFLGVVSSLVVLALDAKGRGPRTVWGWVLIGFHVPVVAFLATGLIRL
jgi:hypothetical protein